MAVQSKLIPVGDPAPWFHSRTRSNERFAFNSVAGRHVVLSFFGSASAPMSRRFLELIHASRAVFDDHDACFFGVTVDATDEAFGRVSDAIPGIRYFFDIDRSVSSLYGVLAEGDAYRCVTYLLDPSLRVLAVYGCNDDIDGYVATLVDALRECPRIGPPYVATVQAPVLVLPRVFEPSLCGALIEYYQGRGGIDSGFMREQAGQTVKVVEYGHKRRRDCQIDDALLRKACMVRMHNRVVPEIQKAFQFQATRMERYIVACYDAQEDGHFRPHRDNTTKGTAHRRFAVSVFLNSGEYEGGFLRFPEFGPALYAAPAGGAVVFSCSLLHEAMPVTRGRRFVFLPFLYDDAARRLREENVKFLA
jgi:peroxiredoxin